MWAYKILSTLFKHERKVSIVHAKAKFQNEFEGQLQSKKPILAHIGFRKVVITPIFSKIYSNCSKFKYQKSVDSDKQWHLLSFYSPIIFQPSSFLAFASDDDRTGPLAMAGDIL